MHLPCSLFVDSPSSIHFDESTARKARGSMANLVAFEKQPKLKKRRACHSPAL
jgi:hypothetical protein